MRPGALKRVIAKWRRIRRRETGKKSQDLKEERIDAAQVDGSLLSPYTGGCCEETGGRSGPGVIFCRGMLRRACERRAGMSQQVWSAPQRWGTAGMGESSRAASGAVCAERGLGSGNNSVTGNAQ